MLFSFTQNYGFVDKLIFFENLVFENYVFTRLLNVNLSQKRLY